MVQLQKLIRNVLFVCLCILQTTTGAENSNPPGEWAGVMPEQKRKWFASADGRIANIIFDAIDEISLPAFDIGSLRARFAYARNVYDNHDLLNTYTVIDRFKLRTRIPLWDTESNPLSLWLGLENGVEFANYRQVLPANYSALPSIEERSKDFDFKDVSEVDGQAWRLKINEPVKKIPIWKQSPENNARFSNFINVLTHPFRFPRGTKTLAKMDIGEIYSYTLSGALEFGAGVGWSYDPVEIVGDFGASYVAYVKGNYRFSVLREDSDHVRIKVGYLGGPGHGPNVGNSSKPSLLDGVFFIKKFQREVKIVPFQLRARQEWLWGLDVSYRYDLSNPDAVEAYEQALIGRLSYSEELAKQNKGVEKTSTRHLAEHHDHSGNSMKLTFLFKRNHRTSYVSTQALIILPNGQKKLFTALVENSREWKTLWGSFEKLKYTFTSSLDLDEYEKNPNSQDSFVLSAEGSIEDTGTTYDEMLSYILEVENATGQVGLIPRPPSEIDYKKNKGATPDSSHHLISKNLGRSRFYYRINLSQPQVESFINTNNNEMWPMIEEVFGAEEGAWSNGLQRTWKQMYSGALLTVTFPLYLVDAPLRTGMDVFQASKIRSRWKKVKQQDDIVEKAKALGRIFYNRYYSHELIHLLRRALNGEEIDYVITAYSPLFGRIWKEGRTQLRFENLASKFQQQIDFDKFGPRTTIVQKEFEIKNTDVSVTQDYKVKIRFRVEKAPRAVFLQAAREDRKDIKITPVANVLIYNDGQFTDGENEITLDPTDLNSPWLPIAKELQGGKTYHMRLAVNGTGVSWGRTSDFSFNY